MAHAERLPFEGPPPSPQPRNRRRQLPIIARASGQRVNQASAGRLVDRVIACLRTDGPSTDHEVAEKLDLALATVNALRHSLLKRDVVRAAGLQRGPFGAMRTQWELVAACPLSSSNREG